MTPPLLVVEDLKTHFFTRRGITRAVDGVSFTLRAGETLALVGESGSGKSVTCLSLVRLVPEPAGRIVGGRVLLDGEDLLGKSPAEMRRVRGKQIAMVLQDPMTSLNPALTIGTQIGEVVRLHQGLRGASLRARALEALLRCLPDIDARGGRLVEIGGQPPDLTRLPPGCPFAPRCSERQPRCETEYPPAVSIDDGHVANCWVALAAGARPR